MGDLLEAIDSKRDEMLKLLEQIVNIDSGTRYPQGVARVGSIVSHHLEDMGFRVTTLHGKEYGDHLYACLGSGQPCVFLMGHMDTVFRKGTAQERPFTLDEVVRRAYGPGVLDMKGGIVVMLYAIYSLLQHKGKDTAGSLRVFLNADEEPGSPESRKYLKTCLEGVNCAFLTEPSYSKNTLVTRRKGVGIFRFSVKGKAAHAGSQPKAGANAILGLIHLLDKVMKLTDRHKGITINVGTITGGKEPYIVPDSAGAAVDVRVPNLDEQKRIERSIVALACEPAVRGTKISIEGGFHRPAMEPVAGTEDVKRVVRKAAKGLGYEIRFSRSPRGGASDGNLITHLGVPCIDGMGPLGSGTHSSREYIEVSSLFNKAKLLALVLDKLLSRPCHVALRGE